MKIKRIFICKNGHSYESKEPITTEIGGELAADVKQLTFFGIPLGFPYFKPHKANDHCKICGEVIVKEDDYVDGKIVMGAVRIKDEHK